MVKTYAKRGRIREQMNVRLESQLVERIQRLARRNDTSLALQVAQLLEKAAADAGEPWIPPEPD